MLDYSKLVRKMEWDGDILHVHDVVEEISDNMEKQMEEVVLNHFDCDFSDFREYMHDKIKWERKQELAMPRWIPVTEQYPEEREAVLVYQRMYKNTYCAFLDGMDWWIYGGYGTKAFGITHWMPLPEPPKEKDDE